MLPNIQSLEKERDVEQLVNILSMKKNPRLISRAALALGRLEEHTSIKPLIKAYTMIDGLLENMF